MHTDDRGWFTWTEERARALDASAREAAEAASTEGWLEAAWARVTDPAFVAALYASRAAQDPSLAEELERTTSRDAESMRVQKELGAARVGPYLVSRLATSSPQGALQRLALGIDVGRPLSEACVDFEGGPLARMLTLAWAASPHASDRKRAVERLHDPRQTPRVDRVVIAAEAHAAGDPEAAPFVLESLRGLLAHHGVDGVDGVDAGTSTEECFDRDGNLAGRLLRALVARPLIDAAPLLVGLFETHEVLLASIACTRCATPGEADAVERYLHTLVGPLSAIAPLRCGAENVLARLGRPRDLVAARALRARGAARYGYPKLADVVVLHRLAADAFRGSDDATSEERAWVRSLRRSPYALLREVAQLEGAVAPDYWDAARTKATLARGELDRAIDALEDATFASTIFGSLKDVALDEARRRRVTELACARLEAGPNPYVESTSELDPDAAAAVGFLKTLPDDEKAALATRSSAWIRAFVTETEPLAREPRATRTPEGASIERLDLAPFVIGKKINGLALGRGGSILAVVGDETAVLVDAQTGLALRRLETTWRWGYDVAFSPDGTCVASVWHGGHVDVHDVASGARRFALEEGHSGVPNGVRSVAWSRDGARLYTGGDDGRLVAWSLEGDAPSIVWTVHEPGGFHAITTFANGDVVASHVKTTGGESNWIARFDGATGAVRERVETKTSIWAIAWRDDDTVATGGEDRLVRIADARKGLGALVASDARTIEAKRTTRLAWEADALFGVTAEGESFVWRAEDAHEGRHATGHALWALAGRFVGGDGGTIDRLAVGVDETSSTTNVANGATPFAHTRKLIAIVPCSADVITVDWDGTFGRFDLAGRGSLLAALGGTPECAVLANDELFVGMRDAVRVLDVATGTVKREIADRHDDVALDANGRVLACSHRTSVVFRDAATLAPLGAPVEVGAGSVNAIAALPDGRFVVGTERGELAILASTNGAWARTWHLHAHGRDRLERGNPHADVCSLVVSRDGSRFVSAATDRTVRVWDVRDSAGPTPMLRRPLTRPTEELRRPLTRPTEELRIAEDFGLFNRLALSPDGRRLAIPTSAGLLVYALDEGNGPIADEDPRLVLREPWDGRFAGKQLTVATFVGERELVVGTEAGAVFRVSLGENVQ